MNKVFEDVKEYNFELLKPDNDDEQITAPQAPEYTDEAILLA